MTKYPMPFTVQAKSESGIQTAWTTSASVELGEIKMAIPPEFEGPGTGFSPEDLFAMALQNCYVATFKVFAEKSRLQFKDIQVKTVLEVDRDDKGRPWMARAHFAITLSGAAQQENARRILERTSQNCMILNSVHTSKTFDYQVVE
jgi:organic hydroperoxide reductase OsmC/OhrA